MKRLIIAVALLCTPAFGQEQSGMALNELCRGHAKGSGDVACGAYLRGFFDGVAMANGGNAADVRICFPDGVTLRQVRLVVEKYLADNPDKLNQDASWLAFAALYLAFPCKPSN
jgi:hypothetical protein